MASRLESFPYPWHGDSEADERKPKLNGGNKVNPAHEEKFKGFTIKILSG